MTWAPGRRSSTPSSTGSATSGSSSKSSESDIASSSGSRPPRHLALLVNRRSGSGAGFDRLEHELRRHVATVSPFAVEDIEAAVAGGVDRIVVAGGDGSIGPAAAAAAAAGIPLALIPVGTANDFARALGIPREVTAASRLAATGTALRTLELARMDGRPFVNVASAGLAAAAAERARAWKRRLGPLAYMLGAAQAGLKEAPLACRIACDGDELYSGDAWQVIVASSGAFGAGASVGVAHPADGKLDATVIEAGSRLRLPARAYGLRAGRIVSQRGVHHARAAWVEVSVPAGTAYNVDGEVVVHGSAAFSIEADGFQVVTD